MILKHVPYGMWNRFSFSVNEDNSKRKVVFETGNSAKSGEYLIDVPHDEKSEPNNNFDWLIWKCIYEDDFRRKLYNEYESGFRAKACIETQAIRLVQMFSDGQTIITFGSFLRDIAMHSRKTRETQFLENAARRGL